MQTVHCNDVQKEMTHIYCAEQTVLNSVPAGISNPYPIMEQRKFPQVIGFSLKTQTHKKPRTVKDLLGRRVNSRCIFVFTVPPAEVQSLPGVAVCIKK